MRRRHDIDFATLAENYYLHLEAEYAIAVAEHERLAQVDNQRDGGTE